MTDTTIQSKPTVITIVLPAAGEEKPASLGIKQGDLGQVSTFAYSDFATICRALNVGLGSFKAVQANPPGDVESAKKTVKPKKTNKTGKAKPKEKDKPAGKAPYHLLNASGKRRELMTMTDPFDVTEKCMKNKKMVFKDLAEAEEIAQMLVVAGEKTITIAFKNGKTAKIIGEDKTQIAKDDEVSVDAVTSDADDEAEVKSTDYPDGIEGDLQQALYDHLEVVELVVAIEGEVNKIKKHNWTNNLIKQREVKAAIHKHVDEDDVEDIYQIFFDIEHIASDTEAGGNKDDKAMLEEDKQHALI